MRLRAREFLLLTWICLATFQQARAECNGRGHLESGACVCDTPAPTQPGQVGYVGEDCEIMVHGGLPLDGSDATASCGPANCSTLHPEQWVCFYGQLDWNATNPPWNFLTIQLNRTSEDAMGDPDLYGQFYEGLPQGKLPRSTTYDYDFRETSSNNHRSVVKKVKKADFAGASYQGVFLCIKAYGDTSLNFSLRAALSQCPGDFSDTGERMECSSMLSSSDKRYSGCNADGTCVCNPPYQKPIPQPYPEIGFEDCSAKVTEVADASFGADQMWAVEHEPVAAQAWNFYAFNVSSKDYQVVVKVAAEEGFADQCTKYGYFSASAKFGQPPGSKYGQWDFRPRWDYYSEDDNDLEVAFDRTMEGFQPGLWYVGVNGEDDEVCNYTLTISKYMCPLNCTGQGLCQLQANGSHACQCNEGFFGRDCSQQLAPLEFGKQLTREQSTFEYHHFQLPELSSSMISHSVEVRFAISFSSSNYGSWATSKPELLLLKGDKDTHPMAGNYTYRLVLEKQNKTYHLDLCPSQLKGGEWRAAVYNPVPIYKVGYNLTISKQAACLNNCSGHGRCSEDGSCQCDFNWAGGDCSVDTSVSECRPGTRQPSRRPEKQGTCWQECVCPGSGNCRFQEGCVDFTCDSARLRRKGGSDECVQDQCTGDVWEEGQSYSCRRECQCPSDGSPCVLAADCNSVDFSCKPGYKRFSDQRTKCFPLGCQDGSLTETVTGSVDHGKAYGVCRCGGTSDEREDEPLCTVQATDTSRMSIVCEAGYTLKGAEKPPDSSVWLGGHCEKGGHGTPAWGVVLWVFFSLLAGGAAGIGALWYYERKLRQPSHNDSMYHELSMDTGF